MPIVSNSAAISFGAWHELHSPLLQSFHGFRVVQPARRGEERQVLFRVCRQDCLQIIRQGIVDLFRDYGGPQGVGQGLGHRVAHSSEPLQGDERIRGAVDAIDHARLQGSHDVRDGKRHGRYPDGLVGRLRDRVSLPHPCLQGLQVPECRHELAGENVDESDLGPSEENEAPVRQGLAELRVILLLDVFDLVVVLEEQRRVEDAHLLRHLPDADSGEPSAAILPQPDLADHVLFVACHASRVQLETQPAAALGAHRPVEIAHDLDPRAALGGKRGELDRVLLRGQPAARHS